MILRLGAVTAAIAAACSLCACSHEHTVACEPTGRYTTATTAAPVRIPDDLNPPDETDSLKLPPEATAVARTKPCLESPPGYYTDGAPATGRSGSAAGRSAPAGAPRPAAAPPPAPPTPAPQAPAPQPPASEPAPTGSDREITN